MSLPMSLHKFALGLCAGLIGVTALAGGTGVARADPEDATPPIIEDLLIVNPPLSQDPRSLDTPNNFGTPRDWGGIGMYCQNRTARCQKGGF
jgi:hypothetical protein